MGALFPFSLAELQAHFGSALVPNSFVVKDDSAFWLEVNASGKRLSILAPAPHLPPHGFQGEGQTFREGYSLLRCRTDHANALALRELLPWLRPGLLGLTTSAGFGDRLGLATPGHVRALERVSREVPDCAIAPVFAQQSMREMSRTNRSPENVLDDATWGAFQAGWRGVLAADADHLKTQVDIDACAAAGYSFYTFDPGAHVDGEVDSAAPEIVSRKLERLPWRQLECSPADLLQRYEGQLLPLEGAGLRLERLDLLRAVAKYGAAIAQVAAMYRHLVSKGIPFELEVSVDETETPTTHGEHFYIASELRRLGVSWVSLAPRYIGRFEKGVDYVGDLQALKADLEGHAAVARTLGPYKLSLHSGSDKFSVYPLINEAAKGLVHLKTAGTSYLEALRVIARVDAPFFREILAFARGRYEEDRASYHVSAEVGRVPAPELLSDEQLPALLEQFDAREVLHVTFGSVLAMWGGRLKVALVAHEDEYYQTLEGHFYRHLRPFA